MDKFGVPKKINRHVIKAISELNDEGETKPNFSNICDNVKYTMRNNVPVADLPSVVRRSLQNLAKLGVIAKQGSNYYKSSDQMDSLQSSSKRISTKIFKRSVKRGDKDERSNVNINKRRRSVLSEDSMSGDEIVKTRKRFRSSRKLSREGRKVELPKASNSMELDWTFTDENSSDENEEENQEENNSVTSNTELKPVFYSEVCENAMVCSTEFDEFRTNNEYLPQVQINKEICNQITYFQNQNQYNQLNKDDVSEQSQNNTPILKSEPTLNEQNEKRPDIEACQDSNDEQNASIALHTEPEGIDGVTNDKIIEAESKEENSSCRSQDPEENSSTLDEK